MITSQLIKGEECQTLEILCEADWAGEKIDRKSRWICHIPWQVSSIVEKQETVLHIVDYNGS